MYLEAIVISFLSFLFVSVLQFRYAPIWTLRISVLRCQATKLFLKPLGETLWLDLFVSETLVHIHPVVLFHPITLFTPRSNTSICAQRTLQNRQENCTPKAFVSVPVLRQFQFRESQRAQYSSHNPSSNNSLIVVKQPIGTKMTGCERAL